MLFIATWMTKKKLLPTKGLAKCGLDNTQHQLLFYNCAAVVKATKLYPTKNFILSFKPAYRRQVKKQQQLRQGELL